MTDKTTPSTESDTADATRKRATGASRRSAAPRRAPARKGGADAAAPAARPRAADEPAAQLRRRVAEREDAARQETAAVLADIARRYQAAGPGQVQEALRAVIEELSPDDARAVHRALLEVNVQACRPPQSGRRAGRGLARGHLSLPPPHAAAQLRKAEVRAAGRAARCRPGSRPPASAW